MQAGCRRWQRWTLPLGWQGRPDRSVIDGVAKNTGITGMPQCTALFLSVPLPISGAKTRSKRVGVSHELSRTLF